MQLIVSSPDRGRLRVFTWFGVSKIEYSQVIHIFAVFVISMEGKMTCEQK
jgi:hypothetical protein